MQLYLVQHAQAKSEAEDPQHSLTEEGKHTARCMADFAARHKIAVAEIWHSGKMRARQTAEIFADALRPPGGVHEKPGLGPMEDVAPVASALAVATDNLMIVGHLPHLSRLTSRLLCQDETKTIVTFQMAGIVQLHREATGEWSLRWVVVPEIVR